MIVYPFSFIKSAAGGLDPDAEAYLNAVTATGGTVTSDITSAVNTLFVDLKNAGLYSKIDILMPMVGATKASMLINAITPTNDLYKWTAFGTDLNYDVSGITGNNNGVLKSNFQMSALTNTVSGSSHFSVYLNRLNQTSGKGYLVGYINTQQIPYTYFNCMNYTTNLYGALWGDSQLGASNTPVTGFWFRNRTATNAMTQYINNSAIQSNNNSITTFGNNLQDQLALFTLYWKNYNANNLYDGEVGDSRYATVTVGAGLDSTERTNLYNIITAFNTALNRA